jgi:hypothetical protein
MSDNVIPMTRLRPVRRRAWDFVSWDDLRLMREAFAHPDHYRLLWFVGEIARRKQAEEAE